MAKRWAQFDRDWAHRPRGRMTVEYRAGKTYFMPMPAFEAAQAAGAAREVERPEDAGESMKPASRARRARDGHGAEAPEI